MREPVLAISDAGDVVECGGRSVMISAHRGTGAHGRDG